MSIDKPKHDHNETLRSTDRPFLSPARISPDNS